MGLTVTSAVILLAVLLTFVGPKLTPYSRKQWALLMTALIVLWIPMGCYLLLVVLPAEQVDDQQVVRAGAINLLLGVPLFIFIAKRWILKK